MLGGVEWELVPETGQLVTRLERPRRDVTIAWDSGDRTLYLSVIAPPVANVPGSQQRLYTAPLSLLAALLIVPQRFHAVLVKTAQEARAEAEGHVLAHLSSAVAKLPQRWPEIVQGREAVEQSVAPAEAVERLALDIAASEAFHDAGAPL